MYRIGLSSSGKMICHELFENYKKAGIECMEVARPQEEYLIADYKAIKKIADEYGIELWSFHLPFKPFNWIDISTSDSEWRKKSVAYQAEILKKAADAGLDKFVLHSGGITKRETQEEVDERLNRACESYAEMAEIADREGAVICVENLPPVCVGKDIAEVKKLLSADDRLRVCFDTNHLLPGDAGEFIRAIGDKIITMHVSDYDFVNERHWFPGEGKLDFQSILSALKDIDYKGPWLYEVRFGTPGMRERLLTCDDFARNAHEIFENKEITIIPGLKKD